MASPPSAHVLLVSAPLQGHVNPLLVLGRRLASRGLLVTFSTAPHAGLKLQHGDKDASISVGRGTFRFEHLSGGDLWAPDDHRNSNDVIRHMENAAPAALADLIRRQTEPVTCVVVNAFAPWALRVAGELGLPHAVLWTESCAVLSLYYHYFYSLAEFPAAEAGPDAKVVVPGLPPLVNSDLPGLIRAPEQFIWRQQLVADLRSLRDKTASWVLINSFDELEHATFQALRPHLPIPILPVGPLYNSEVYYGGHDKDDVAVWLDTQPPRSVVFVAFGSLVKFTRDEVAEVAAGLAATGRPFLWVLRDDNRGLLLPDDDCLAPVTGDSSSSNGKVVAWCEQSRVLAHRAVGCFVTHCGWNSAAEALAAGVPVVAYPFWGDQTTNAMFLTDVFGVGVRLPRPMTREALRCRVEEVMNGPEVRDRACNWKAAASAALADDGSSDKGVQDFVNAVLSIGVRAGSDAQS